MPGAVSKARPRTLPQRIWELQVRLSELASDLVTVLSGTVGKTIMATLSLFLIFYPALELISAYRSGILLLSIPLPLMLLGGLFGLRLSYSGWSHD